MKRTIAFLLALCLLMGFAPGVVAAAQPISGTYGENIRWSFDESTGVLTLAGAGDMELSDSGYPWLAYKDDITEVVFDESLTKIGDEAFHGCTALKHVEIPGTIQEIGSFAFGSCTGLESVEISDGVTNMGMYIFNGCTALKNVTLPGTVERLDNTFDSCTALEYVAVPEGVTEMWDTFAQCYNLKSVYLPSTVECIFGAFADCRNLSYLVLPEGLTVIGNNAFFGCISLKNLVIPSTVSVIQEYCFCGGKDANGSYQKGVDPIYFLGDAPQFGEYAFRGDVFSQQITCYYPQGNDTWTEDVMQDYGGDVIWAAYDPATELPQPIEPQPPKPIVNPFSDVKEADYFYEPVLWAYSNGITSGTSATTFSPDDKCTRAQIVTFLWRAEGEPTPSAAKNPFKDVKQGDYYYDAVLWAVENGITSGTSSNTFSPNQVCTRGQVATFLWRTEGEQEPSSGKNPFSDVKSGEYYYKAVLWAVEQGITQGVGNGKFDPNGQCTRGQIVTFLYRNEKN